MAANKKTTKSHSTGHKKAPAQKTPAPQMTQACACAQNDCCMHERTYKGISIAMTALLYCIILFMLYVYFNYEISFYPKI